MKFKLLIALLITASFSSFAEIRQDLGVDQNVDYASLTQYGPWDDRNYNLTAADIAILPADDQYLANVPVFFKIWKRREMPHIGKFYPRATLQHFQILHGGLIVDGIWYKEELGIGYHPDAPNGKVDGVEVRGTVVTADNEVALATGVSGNEVSIECNPTNNDNCVAGSNQTGGQTMFYSNDSGVTWTQSQTNPSSCCDPTVDWSSDGSIVYQADLSSSIGVRWTRSLDQGVTWEAMKVLTPSGSDKEWIHVDRSLTSPYVDNVYLTYHNGNVMQFARSTDMGVSMDTPIAFGGDPTGIGSDITTDSAGNIYYIYASLSSATGVRVLKSTDGGATFGPSVMISALRGRFDFPIPSMETREAFIYASADVDSNDNIYVTVTDETTDSVGGGNGSAAANHGEIRVFKSSDAGVTWSELPSPHPTADALTVDRYHPWLMVGENDAVHIGFYDTRHSVNRTGVDFYYNVSTDGGASWLPEGAQRFSTATSSNLTDGQEWGDYNGLSVVLDKIAMTWTDNRSGKVAMAGTAENQYGSPTFNIAAAPNSFDVCANDTGNTSTLSLSAVQGYPGTITLSVDSAPAYVNNTAFSANAQVADYTSDFSFDVDGTGTTGTDTITILASGDDLGDIIEKTSVITLNYSAGAATGATLTAPVDAASNVPAQPTFTWTADANAISYLLEVATDNSFSNIVISETVNDTTFSADSDLSTSTEHFWRVTAQSPCGDSVSSVFSFTTTVAPGDCPIGTLQADVHAFDFDGTPVGPDVIFIDGFDNISYYAAWSVDTAVGAENWSLQPLGDGGSMAYQAQDLAAVNDTSLVSPVMNLPTGMGPLTLRFWNTQTIEDQGAASCYDSALLEISVDGGAFVQVTNADIINDDYSRITLGGFDHPFPAGTEAWCGDPQAATVYNVNADNNAGSDVQYRFRMASDSSVGRPEGWAIDNVRLTGCIIPPTQ